MLSSIIAPASRSNRRGSVPERLSVEDVRNKNDEIIRLKNIFTMLHMMRKPGPQGKLTLLPQEQTER